MASSHTVYQFHYEQWFDKKTPENTFSLLHFRHKVRSFDNQAKGPLVVHCSAGVGRTGTYMALDYLLEQVKHVDEVNVVKCVQQMRQHRMYMIQNLEQYCFLYLTLAEAVEVGEVVIPSKTFADELPALKAAGAEGHSAIERQFVVLNGLKDHQMPCEAGHATENLDKNRNEDLIPVENCRVFLSIPHPNLTGYINAVYLHSYKKRDALIATQYPMPNTVIDFWSMVAQYHCKTIVSLTEPPPDDSSYASYLPSDTKPALFGPVLVTAEKVNGTETRGGIIVRELNIARSEKRYSQFIDATTVCHFQLKGWHPDSLVPPDKNNLIDLIEVVRQWQARNEDGPIVIHCNDGVRQSCYYYAACRIIEQIDVDKEVDVFTAVRNAHAIRPQCLTTLAQYQSLYELAAIYLSRDDQHIVYANSA